MADKRETSRNQAQDPSISFTCSLDADSGGISNVSFEHDGVRYRAGTKGRMKLRGRTMTWIAGNFRKKKCTLFVPDPKKSSRCCCGRPVDRHGSVSLPPNIAERHKDLVWDKKTHIESMPTNAFGEIEFSGAGRKSRAKYIRVADDTDGKLALKLLLREWKLEFPRLLISVTGGAKTFKLPEKLKQLFRQGLFKVAQTTGAWVITGGTNTGVMKHVGEALQGASKLSSGAEGRNRVYCIGIATWGIVDHRELLVKPGDTAIQYHMTSSMISQGACLDNNHTHFLLVDDGTINKYGVEINFRARLEKCIMDPSIVEKNRGESGVPAVQLVLEGGPNTILTMYEAISQEPPIPVVVIKDSGRAADLIAFAYNIQHGEGPMYDLGDVVEHTQLMKKIEKTYPDMNQEACLNVYKNILKCVEKKEYITIFRMEEGTADIDQAILQALMKSKRTKPEEQLRLALLWNRADIARSEIFNEEQKWKLEDLEKAMKEALAHDRVEFVELLLEHGVNMSTFLSNEKLEALYNIRARKGKSMMKYVVDKDRICRILQPQITPKVVIREQERHIHDDIMYDVCSREYNNNSISLADIGKAFARLAGSELPERYCGSGTFSRGMKEATTVPLLCVPSSPYIATTNPYNDLFLWAVLNNMQEMALLFWRLGDEAMAKSLVACKLYHSLMSIADRRDVQDDIQESLEKNEREFQKLSVHILDECFHADENRAGKLLTYNLESWGDQTCLNLAVSARHEVFVAHSCSQSLLSAMWIGAMTFKQSQSLQSPHIHVRAVTKPDEFSPALKNVETLVFSLITDVLQKAIGGILFPPLVMTYGFRSLRELRQMPKTEEEHEEELEDELEEEEEEEKGTEAMDEDKNGVQLKSFNRDSMIGTSFYSPSRSQSSLLTSNTSRKDAYTIHSSEIMQEPQLQWWQKYVEFYRAPITKFWSNVLVYLVFLSLYSYVVLVKMPPKPSVQEWILIAFIISLTTEEIRQFLHSDASEVFKKLKEWGSSKWNQIDAVAICLFFVGLGLRFHDNGDVRSAGHVIYSIDVMLWIVRLLDIFSVNKHLGPYVVMIGRMTIDMLYFLFILAVFLLAYGVARHAILFPNEPPSFKLLREVVFAPYFQTYGEMFMERTSTATVTYFGTTRFDRHGEPIVALIMAFYLLVANILLLNLLIAIFNNTFSEVQANSNQIWKYERYDLIIEYAKRPFLVPPFIIINHIYIIGKYIYRKTGKCRCCNQRRPSSEIKRPDRKLKFFPKPQELHELMVFEEECLANYLRKKDGLLLASQEEKIRLISERVDTIGYQLTETSKEAWAREKKLKTNVRRIEDKLESVQKSLTEAMSLLHEERQSSRRQASIVRDSGPGPRRSTDVTRTMDPAMTEANQENDDPPDAVTVQQSQYPTRRRTHSEGHGQPTEVRRRKFFSQQHSLDFDRVENPAIRKAATHWRRGSLKDLSASQRHTGGNPSSPLAREAVTVLPTLDSVESNTSEDAGDDELSPRNEEEKSGLHPQGSFLKRMRGFDETADYEQDLIPLKHLVHFQARQSPYPMSNTDRQPVPEIFVTWLVDFPEYNPPEFTATTVLAGLNWADPKSTESIKFNEVDDDIDRKSFCGSYDVSEDGLPRNPMGRTGLTGRGLLGRWGPNHAADPVITRWKKNLHGENFKRGTTDVLEFLSVQRKGEWALPGGILEPGRDLPELVLQAFGLGKKGSSTTSSDVNLKELTQHGLQIYCGYVDDSRNTDNAWMETRVINYHDETGEITKKMKLTDTNLAWQELSSQTPLHTNHVEYLRRVAEERNAYFADSRSGSFKS